MLTLTIKVKYIDKTLPKLQQNEKGDWIDLYSAKELTITNPHIVTATNRNGNETRQYAEFNRYAIPLNVCMELPKGYEAILAPRSSTYKNYGIICQNSFGIIDNTYCGDKDEWGFPSIFMNQGRINIGDRIAQFRVQLSQFAPWYVKLKWLFTNKIRFIEVEHLGNTDRGGYGNSGR